MKEYVDNMVGICREIRRVMKPTGTFWLNVGDSYDNKNLCMVPNRLAIALQDDGWYVRSEIIWHKPSCMPEGVTDRPTRAHEKIWLLSKNSNYYYDLEIVREKFADKRNGVAEKYAKDSGRCGDQGLKTFKGDIGRNLRNVWDCPESEHEKIWLLTKNPRYYYDFYGVVEQLNSSPKPRGQKLDDSRGDGSRRNEIWGAENPYRNLRNVWSISPKGYAGAHFATFPQRWSRDVLEPDRRRMVVVRNVVPLSKGLLKKERRLMSGKNLVERIHMANIMASPKKTMPLMGFKTRAPSRRVFSPAWSKNARRDGVGLVNARQVG